MTPLQKSNQAAIQAFDEHLDRHRATATASVPEEVILAAQKAYAEAGGTREIVVVGHGNRTHPVCCVSVAYKKRGH